MTDRFNDTVAARTRAAAQILQSEEMLAVFKSVYGSEADLTAIRDHGRRAEALNLAQTKAQEAGSVATLQLLEELADVQRKYVLFMSALRAERGAQVEAGAPAELIKQIDTILADQAQVSVYTAVLADGARTRSQKPSKAQEATRAEIERDLQLMIELTELHPALAARNVTVEGLTALRDRAKALAGKLATRAERKGGAKGATKAEREAAKQQSIRWSASYGTLAAAAAEHPGIAQLLREGRAAD